MDLTVGSSVVGIDSLARADCLVVVGIEGWLDAGLASVATDFQIGWIVGSDVSLKSMWWK
jgi:hypothetical protein